GDNLPEIVKKRIDKELNSIITNKFSNLYLLAHNVVQKAKNDGIIVGSRGSVGSSIVAFFAGITDVNALPPHYVCANCKLSMFDAPAEIETGFDLPDKKCPNCGEQLNKDGHNIFFEVFLGFEGDKVPDIDLNFPGYYQPIIHKYVEELFGANNVYRAGTISKVSDGIAKIIVNKFAEERQINWTAAEKLRIAKGCCEVKKTTGQHPGGIIIVPKSKEIYDFCPIQYPSDENSEEVITTHFDYHKMEEQLVKLDLLGHDNPAQLLLLREYTGFDFNDIPYNDEKTLQLFSSVKSIGVSEEELGASVATFAIPEFGTDFVRGMLEDTRPKNIGDLIRICGLAHGTNVWQGNAQELIRKKITNLNGVISARDNIMLDLINKGMDAQKAFKIMEKVRKGKGLNDDEIKLMIEHKVAKWYIDSCRKIEYLFPKAHAVAYTILSYKIAYYKIHYPMEFYASYFTIKATDLNLEHLLLDVKSIKKLLDEYYDKKRRNELTTKEYTEISILEVIKEAKLRNIEIMNVDIEKSETFKSLVIDKKILPPLVSIEGLGSKVAENIVAERKKQGFRTIKELCERCKINKKVLEALKKFNCFGDLPETEQYSLF
ncbi:MAG TPA: PolC-type DNA polymerase III, partial [bacterium]|nr:PolC-type DNA polymerase III [bacterium]